ncbi:MAG TPA: hypothetical protein PKB06_07315, partial [Actinotalea sp.]|nr:hypothetical protein [Actinotalea sp.]
TRQLTAQLSSPPARLMAGRALDSVVTGPRSSTARAQVLVPVSNAGGTTATAATVEVQLPTDLPAGVTVEHVAVQGTYWTCTPAQGGLTCTAPAIRPRTSYPLGLQLTVPALEGAAAPLLDVDLTTAVQVRAPAGDGSARLTVRSAPGEVEVDLTSPTSVDAELEGTFATDVRNAGGTTVSGVRALVSLPAGVDLTELTAPDGWACTSTGDGPSASGGASAQCVLPSLAPLATSRLALGVTAAGDATGEIAVSFEGAPGVSPRREDRAVSTLDVMLPELAFGNRLAADLVEGRTGTLSFSVTGAGRGAARAVEAVVALPASLRFGELAPGDLAPWTCTRTDDRHVTCRLPRLDAGASAPLLLPARATAATSGQATVTVSAANAPDGSITGSVSPRVASAGLAARGSWSGAYAVTEIGAPVLSCNPTTDSGCAAARAQLDGSAQNNNYAMVQVESSTAALVAPGRVVFAGLYWSANRYTTESWTGPLDTVELRAPGAAEFAPVSGTVIADVTDNSSRRYYQSFADVTSLVQQGGTVEVRGVATAATRTDPVRTYYGGWALVVVYASPGADRSITLYDGGAWIASNASSTFPFAADEAQTGRVGVVAWDGDRGVGGGDQLVLNGTTALTPIRWDGSPGSAYDAFTSTAMGSPWANSLGVDAKPFAPVQLGAGVHRLTASTGGDQYLIGAVTVTTGAR